MVELVEKKERRRAPRAVLRSAWVSLYSQKAPDEKELKGRICDISALGVKFISNKPYTIDSKIDVGLLLPNFNSLINISGRMVRRERISNDKYQIALEFDGDYHQHFIREYIRIMQLWDGQWKRKNE